MHYNMSGLTSGKHMLPIKQKFSKSKRGTFSKA